ncbi:MAG: VCBS repeat-containing protein [Gemmatimonadetes bacterium]|nr:VCBS repeat-containing protein [Gemmatimonadota bacterium]
MRLLPLSLALAATLAATLGTAGWRMDAVAGPDTVTRPRTPLRFATHPIDSGFAGGYQVIVADVNHDGKPDLIALASGLHELRWYENPTWRRHVLVDGLDAPINADAADLDGDGIPEIALAHGFSTRYAESAGIVSLLTHGADVGARWTMREIDQLPTSHRLRFADVDGTGRPVLVNWPLIGAGAIAHEYRATLPLVFYRPGAWRRETVSESLQGVVHGILVAPWARETRASVWSAGFEGVDRWQLGPRGWTRTHVLAGDASAWPRSGASEIVVGHAGGERFLATIEPWHGGQVVVYRERGGAWVRHVIDATIVDGHTLVAGDFDGDGIDELVVGERQGAKGAYVYRLTDVRADAWTRDALDDGTLAPAGCAVADLNGDGRADVACIGSTQLRWYENRRLGPVRARDPPHDAAAAGGGFRPSSRRATGPTSRRSSPPSSRRAPTRWRCSRGSMRPRSPSRA